MFGDGPEVAGHTQSEWDRQLETLDKHQVENHEIQLRLLRDQVSRFTADLFGLRQTVSGLAAKQEAANELLGLEGQPPELSAAHPPAARGDTASNGNGVPFYKRAAPQASLFDRLQRAEQELASLAEARDKTANDNSVADRLRHLEQLMGEAAGRSDKSMEATHWRLDQLGGSLSELSRAADGFERSMQSLDLLQSKVDALEGGLQEQRSQLALQAPLQGRVSSAESLLAEARELFMQDGASARAKLDQLQLRVGELQEHTLKDAAAARAKMDKLQSHVSGLQDQALQDVAATRASLDQLQSHVSDLQEHGAKARDLQRLQTELGACVEAQRASTAARFDVLEATCADAGKRLGQSASDVGAVQTRLGELGREVASLRHVQSQHTSIPERLGYLEEALAESSSQHAEAAQASHTRLEQVSCRLQACERLGTVHSDAQREMDALIADIQKSSDARLSSLKDRLGGQESATQELAQSVEALKGSSLAQLADGRSRHDRLEERLGLSESAAVLRSEELRDLSMRDGEALRLHVASEVDAQSARLELAEAARAEVAARLEERLKVIDHRQKEHQNQVDKLSKRFMKVQLAFSATEIASEDLALSPE